MDGWQISEKTVIQLTAELKAGDWISEKDCYSVPHWDAVTTSFTLEILYLAGIIRKQIVDGSDCPSYQWIK